MPILLGIDRASEQQKFFKKQIRARVLFLSSPNGYTKLFGTNKGIIAYATTGNHTRMQSMTRWTREVLMELDKKRFADRFRFCSLAPFWEQDESTLFLTPLWYRPYDKKPLALLS